MKESIKKKSLLYLGGTFLVLLIGLLVFDLFRKGIYNTKMGLNLAVVSEEGISLLLLRPEEDMISWVKIPNDVKIKIYNSEASYPIVSLWSFGVGEKNPFEVVEKSLGQSMGIIVSRTVYIEQGGQAEDVLGKMLSINLKTNLSFRDRLEIRKFLSDSLKSKKILELNLPLSVFDKEVEADGKEFFIFNSTMSLWTKNKMALEPVLYENADISINNVSNVAGAGVILSKQLESSGMHVIEVKADQEDKIPGGKGCFYATKKNFEMTEEVLRLHMKCNRVDQNGSDETDERLKIWIK